MSELSAKVKSVCDALDELAIRESNAGYGRISVPAKELNELTKAVNELCAALAATEKPS